MARRLRVPFIACAPHLRRARFDAVTWLLLAAVWLGIGVISIKASYLGAPWGEVRDAGQSYLRALAAISYADVLFVAAAWIVARVVLMGVRRAGPAAAGVPWGFVVLAAALCLYHLANVIMFSSFGGFLTYPLLALVGDLRMLRSSIAAYLSRALIAGLIGVPAIYVGCVWLSAVRLWPERQTTRATRVLGAALILTMTVGWILLGWQAHSERWTTRADRAIAENPEWVFVSSWWRTLNGGGTVRMAEEFDPADLEDFAPLGARLRERLTSLVPTKVARVSRRPLNVIFIVLESVAARWTSLNSRLYTDTTPSLVAELRHGVSFDNFYAHIGRSSNSLVAMLMSAYPKLDFRDITDEYPRLEGTSIASLFREHGYRTAFITPSDLNWAGWKTFFQGRGFDDIKDYHQLPCTAPLSSWGVEDRCMIDGIMTFIKREPTRPFFMMGWTQQTHHPYEPTPGLPLLQLVREPVQDDYDLNRYLNILRETDRQLGRLFNAIRRAGLDQQTMVVVVGDHGQAFGYPHESNFFQGRTVYEEDVHVPLMLWYPRRYRATMRSGTIGGHVDLAPTIAELAGLAAPPDWQGRSLFDPDHAPRAYFYVAEDYFRLGVREFNWKYIYDLREGVEELYDLDRDPSEQENLAAADPERSARLRQRLSAWTEANHRQYGR